MTNVEPNRRKISAKAYAKRFEAWPTPALLRAARDTYRFAIRARLAVGGFEDVPRNGPYMLGAMVNGGVSASDAIGLLGVTKQAASQLIDTLAVRGYLERIPDQVDRRRMNLNPTERGRAAAAAVLLGVQEVDAELAKRVKPSDWTAFRALLGALAQMGMDRDVARERR